MAQAVRTTNYVTLLQSYAAHLGLVVRTIGATLRKVLQRNTARGKITVPPLSPEWLFEHEVDSSKHDV